MTYPIVTAHAGRAAVKSVRGFSDFGYSYVYAIFEEGTDVYWARSRTRSISPAVLPRLPQGVKTEMGPDATGLGWVFSMRSSTSPASIAWRTCALSGLVSSYYSRRCAV